MSTTTNVAHGMRGVHEIATTPAQEDVVNFDRDCNTVRIIADGGDDLYVSTDGTDPVDKGPNCERCPIGVTTILDLDVLSQGNTTVKVWSQNSSVVYSVTGS